MSKATQIRVSDNFIAIGSKGRLKAFSVHDGSCLFHYSHDFDNSTMDGNSNPLEEKLEDMCISKNEKFLCAMYSDKRITVVDTQSWVVVNSLKVKRRPTAMTMETDSEHILAADKSGDLYRYNVTCKTSDTNKENTIEEEMQPILGHVSMILDVSTSVNGKYTLTADRDEKLRVSLSQKPYVIESFCLGHEEFVCKILPLSLAGKSLALSTSGDSTVRLWDVENGKELMKWSADLEKKSNEASSDSQTKHIPSILSVNCDNKYFVMASNQAGQSSIKVFELDGVEQTFRLLSEIVPAGVFQLCDARFATSSSHLYVLAICADTKALCLHRYVCNSGILERLEGDIGTKFVTSELKDFPVESSDTWSSFYKARFEGEVYSSYFKRKEDRIAEKIKGRHANGAPEKRAKIS